MGALCSLNIASLLMVAMFLNAYRISSWDGNYGRTLGPNTAYKRILALNKTTGRIIGAPDSRAHTPRALG